MDESLHVSGPACSLSVISADLGVGAALVRCLEAMAEPLEALCGEVTPQQAVGESSALQI